MVWYNATLRPFAKYDVTASLTNDDKAKALQGTNSIRS